MTGVFPWIFKTAKVVPVFKKDSKLDYSNYRPISLLSNIEEILEKRMYKRLYIFLNENNVVYNLRFGFRQQCSTSHALINITKNIREALDEGNISCGVFVDLQKAFDTVDHKILLAKLNHYGIRVLGPHLFLLYINDLNQAINFCKVHHFADDTNLLCQSNSIKKLNKLVNADLKHLGNWLNANKISLNIKKTEMVIFDLSKRNLKVI